MSGRRADDPPVINSGLGKELLDQVLNRPPSADIREAHELAALEATAAAENARAELYKTLHILGLEARGALAEWRARQKEKAVR